MTVAIETGKGKCHQNYSKGKFNKISGSQCRKKDRKLLGLTSRFLFYGAMTVNAVRARCYMYIGLGAQKKGSQARNADMET